MKVKNGKIIEATENEMFGYWLKSGYCEILSFGDYKQRCIDLGTKVTESEVDTE